MPKAVPFARLAPWLMAAAALGGCSTVAHFREGPGSGGTGRTNAVARRTGVGAAALQCRRLHQRRDH